MSWKVLFVDDEEHIISSVHRFMDEWLEARGMKMEGAGSVDEALALLEKEPEAWSVVVSDLRMPGKLGTVLLQKVQEQWPDMSTILLTGYAEMNEIKKAIRAGIVSFLQKPWDPEMVKAEVGKAIELADLKRANRAQMDSLIKESQWARKIHRSLLLEGGGDQSGALGLAYHPAEGQVEGGGDFFQLLWDQPDALAFCLGTIDVNGTQGTYFALLVRDMIKDWLGIHGTKAGSGPHHLLEHLNNLIAARNLEVPGCFLSLTVCVADKGRQVLELASAGGEGLFLLRKGGLEEHRLPSPGLGYKDGLIFSSRTYPLARGERLVMVSRAVMELEGVRERFEEVLGSPVQAHGDQDLAGEILGACHGEAKLPFDMTVIVLTQH